MPKKLHWSEQDRRDKERVAKVFLAIEKAVVRAEDLNYIMTDPEKKLLQRLKDALEA